MKKIAFIIGYYPLIRGGAELQSRYFCDAIKDTYEIFYISIHSMHKKNEVLINDGVKIYIFCSKLFLSSDSYTLFHKNDIYQILKKERPDFIYIQDSKSSLGFAAKYCQKNNCKLIFHIASSVHAEPRKINFSKRVLFDLIENKITNYGIKNADFIIYQAEYQKKLFTENFYDKKSSVIYNIHKPVGKELIKEKPIKVLWVSNIKDLKRPHLFIEIAEKFSNNDQIRFIMIGRNESSDYNNKLAAFASNLSNFQYLGEIDNDNVNANLDKAHILVNTSTIEGFPNVFVQAWLREVVIVSMEIDPDDILVKRGIGYKSGSIDQMIKDINFLISNDSARTNMGKKARVFAEDVFNWDKNVQKFKNVFNEL